LTIYIAEAHAQDEWPISSSRFTPNSQPVIFNKPVTDEERCNIARIFVKDFKYRIPVLVDAVVDDFEAKYAPWPLRFFVLQRAEDGQDVRMVYAAQPRNCGYDVSELRELCLKLRPQPKPGSD